MRVSSQLLASALALFIAVPLMAYDFPLSQEAIRDAYALGTREDGVTSQFLNGYRRSIPNLKQGTCTSDARISTPFFQLAEYAGRAVNYSAQNAIADFYGKPSTFRVYLNVCYMTQAPPPNSIRIKVVQHKREILPLSDVRAPYAEPAESSYLANNGETATLELDPRKLDSSILRIIIETPDGQRALVKFDLGSVR